MCAEMDTRDGSSTTNSRSSGGLHYGGEARMWSQVVGADAELMMELEEGVPGREMRAAATDPRRPRTPEPWGEEAAFWEFKKRLEVRKGKSVERRRGCGEGNNRVMLNVGGQFFETSVETLAFDRQSMLAAKVMRHMNDADEIVWLDRDPERFRHVLNYLRSQSIWLDSVCELRAVQEEADYFNLGGLHQMCEERILKLLRTNDENNRSEQRLEEMQGYLKTLTDNLEGVKTNGRKEPISGVRKRRLDYENCNEPVFKMDEDF